MPKDAFGGTYSKNTLVSGPHQHQSGIIVFDTTAELKASKASKGTMAFSIDEGTHGAVFVYTGAAWKKVAFAAG